MRQAWEHHFIGSTIKDFLKNFLATKKVNGLSIWARTLRTKTGPRSAKAILLSMNSWSESDHLTINFRFMGPSNRNQAGWWNYFGESGCQSRWAPSSRDLRVDYKRRPFKIDINMFLNCCGLLVAVAAHNHKKRYWPWTIYETNGYWIIYGKSLEYQRNRPFVWLFWEFHWKQRWKQTISSRISWMDPWGLAPTLIMIILEGWKNTIFFDIKIF